MSVATVYLLPDGTIQYPVSIELDGGFAVGDGWAVAKPGTPEYERWLPFAKPAEPASTKPKK